jgi:hypothetical protein
MAELDESERDTLRAKLVKELVDLGMDEWDAHFAGGLYLGEHDGDIVVDPPTKEHYRTLGLDRDFLFDPIPEPYESMRCANRARRLTHAAAP